MRWLLLVLTLAACNDNLPVSSFIDKIRVLAIQASPAQVAPGTATRLNPLVVEPEASISAQLSALWLACNVPPGSATTDPCGLGVLDGSTLPSKCGAQQDGTLCTLSQALYTTVTPARSLIGSDGTGELLVTLIVTDDPAGAVDCYLGTLKNDGLPTEPDRCVIAYKRVGTADPTIVTPNQNPTIESLVIVDEAGTSQSLLSSDATATYSTSTIHQTQYTLSVLRSADSAEIKPDGTYEALSLSWFADAGSYDGDRSDFDPAGCTSQADCAMKAPTLFESTTWDSPPRSQATTQTNDGRMRFWTVLRDDRGGVGWHTGELTLGPSP